MFLQVITTQQDTVLFNIKSNKGIVYINGPS